jgi:hypothetical protein
MENCHRNFGLVQFLWFYRSGWIPLFSGPNRAPNQ